MRFSALVANHIDPPVEATYQLLQERPRDADVMDLSQASPPYAPAPEVVEHIAAVSRHPDGSRYTLIAGLPLLRQAFAAELCESYRGTVGQDDVMITAGCNQAFCFTVSALAAPGDEIVLGLPYFFNHHMWLCLQGIVPRYLEPGADLLPDIASAEALITPRTRAIALVSPGNPTGVALPPELLTDFAALARRHDIALVVDETYRSFRDTSEPAHALFADPRWRDTFVSLHSFSKELAIPGHRVGAVVAAPRLQREIAKLMDCAAICAPRIGQEAAWAGLVAAGSWRAARVAELADKRACLADAMTARPGGFELLSTGAFFAWLRHPFVDRPTEDVVRQLAVEHGLLVMAGTDFEPRDRATIRVSVSNLDRARVGEFTRRLSQAHRPAYVLSA